MQICSQEIRQIIALIWKKEVRPQFDTVIYSQNTHNNLAGFRIHFSSILIISWQYMDPRKCHPVGWIHPSSNFSFGCEWWIPGASVLGFCPSRYFKDCRVSPLTYPLNRSYSIMVWAASRSDRWCPFRIPWIQILAVVLPMTTNTPTVQYQYTAWILPIIGF